VSSTICRNYFQATHGDPNTLFSHTWSLAIEEQFYLFYPITFALICRYLPRHQKHALIALTIASFAVCVWGSYHAPAANYFLTPSRAWELLLGGALATSAQRTPKSQLANELLSVSALVTLALVGHWYGPTTRYPGLYAIAPCAASAILIQTGRQQSTLVGKLLSLRPLVFTGLISYSLYLWHYPVLVLSSYYNIVEISGFGLSVLIASIYFLAVASWKILEMPIRKKIFLKSNRSFVSWALIVNIVILSTGVLFWKSDGLLWRFPPETQARGSAWLWEGDVLRKCEDISFDKIASGGLCSFWPQDNDAVTGVVWGDSHAMALLPAYEKLAKIHHMRLYFAIRSSCRPLVGFINRLWSESARGKCAGFNAAVAQAVRQLNPSLLILNAHWIDADADIVSLSNAGVDPGESNFTQGLRETLRQTGSINRSVCVVLDVPEFKYDLPTALGVARKRGIAEDFLKVTRADAQEYYLGPERDIRALAQHRMLRYVDPKDLLCRGDSCIFEANGDLLYGDGDHLSWAGAQFVASAIDGCFRDITPIETE